MPAEMKNSDSRYGWVTKTLHWAGFLLIVNQFVAAAAMINAEPGETQDALYAWHKSSGVLVLALVIVRFIWRTTTPLPEWAPNLSAAEKRTIHYIERVLYLCMFLMPLSGYTFVMAGDYPLNFYGLGDVPDFVGVNERLALAAQWTHKLTAIALGAALLAHWGVIVRHHRTHRDRYVHRMLPFTHQQ